jgi:serine/threonine-protein kinase
MSPSSDPASVVEVRQRFIAAWEDTARGGAAPTVEAYLGPIAEPERSQLRAELEALDRSYRARRSAVRPAAADTGVAADTGPAGTVDYQPAVSVSTGEYVPAPPVTTVDYVPGEVRAVDGKTSAAPRATAVPDTVAGYEILGVLGRGGMGVVYRARQPGLKRLVALKMIRAGGHADAHDLARFRTEAEMVARLQHPNIVQIYEVGDDQGQPYFSLEFVDGTSLKEKIGGTPQPPREAAALARTLAEAMDYAHQNGIIHRDLKPANVLLTRDGVPKVGDFGLARRLEEDSGQTSPGAAVGTPSYMAPEQAEGRSREAGPLADVYSLGAILYELLTGRAPFRGASVLETLQQVRTREPVAPTQFQPGVPRDLETICLKCLAKDPAKRYASAAALAEDLRRLLAGEPILARPVSQLERTWRWCRRNPGVAGPSAAAALFVVGWAVTSSALAWNLKVQKDETDKAWAQAVENAAKEKKQAEIAVQNAAKYQLASQEAKDKHDKAVTEMVRLVQYAHNKILSKRSATGNAPALAQLRNDMLNQLRQSVMSLASQMDKNWVSIFGEIRAHQQLGDLMKRSGQPEHALWLYRKGYDTATKVMDEHPDSDTARANAGLMRLAEGDVYLELQDDAEKARDAYLEGNRLHQDVFAHPRNHYYSDLQIKFLVSLGDCRLGKAYLYLGDPVAARKHLQQCRTYREEGTKPDPSKGDPWSWLAEAEYWLGIAAWHLGDRKGMDEHFGEALRICKVLEKDNPNDFNLKSDMVDIHGAYGDAQLRLGLVAEADRNYQQARAYMQAVMTHDPDDVSQQPRLAQLHERLASLAARRGDRAEAQRRYQLALQVREDLLQIGPKNGAWQASHALTLARCGKHAEAAAAAEKLRQSAAGGTELLLQVARCYAVCAALDTPQQPSYRAKALEALQAATQKDYRDATALVTDGELAPLRKEPAYLAIVGRAKVR